MSSSEHSSRSNSQQGGAGRSSGGNVGTPGLDSYNESGNLGQRSVSLSTLQPTVIEPRMAQLETLEAKMASIEVSLSSTPRRKKNGLASLGASIRASVPKDLALKELESLRNALRDKENIIQSLKGQLTVPGLRINGLRNNNSNNVRELTDVEKRQAEERLSKLKNEVDNKRLAIKNLKMALERLDITDNIDVRIQQAELEYQLGREELNLLSLLEESRTLQLCIEESNRLSSESHTLYSCVEGNERIILQGVEVEYDPKSPKFGAGEREGTVGIYVDWTVDDVSLKKDDRLIEVNGKIVLNKSRDDLMRLLAAAPDPAQIVVLRKIPQNGEILVQNRNSKEMAALRTELEETRGKAEETQRTKEVLRTDNIRLTHRISYLEEQVSELLNRKPSENESRSVRTSPTISTVKSNRNVTNISITSSPQPPPVKLFQKGGAALDPKEPSCPYQGRSKSSLSNVSNTHISNGGDYYCPKGQHARHKHRTSRSGVQSPVPHVNDKISLRKQQHHHHHHHSREKDYNSETNSEHIKRYNKRNHDRYSADFARTNSEKEYPGAVGDVMDQSYKKATKIVDELTRSTRPNIAMYEKHRQRCAATSEGYNVDILRHYNARKSTSVADFCQPKYDSKSIEDLDVIESSPRITERMFRKIQDARSVKSLDFDSDSNFSKKGNPDYNSESGNDYVRTRPTPPKKPVRLSLHKTHSLQSVENNERKSMKRNYKGEISDIPLISYEQPRWNHRNSLDGILDNGHWC